MTILVSSVGDSFVSILQEKTRKQVGDNDYPKSASGVPTNNDRAQICYIRRTGKEVLQPMRELPDNELALRELVQNSLPQELIKLSQKVMQLVPPKIEI